MEKERTNKEHELLRELRVVGCSQHDLVAVDVFLDVTGSDQRLISMLARTAVNVLCKFWRCQSKISIDSQSFSQFVSQRRNSAIGQLARSVNSSAHSNYSTNRYSYTVCTMDVGTRLQVPCVRWDPPSTYHR